MHDKVVITGAGMVCSLGHSSGEVWDALLAGRGGAGPIEGFDARGFGCRVAAQVAGLTCLESDIQPRIARIMDKHFFMLLKCTRDALMQSAITAAHIPRDKIGFFVGMGMVDYKVEDLLPAVRKSCDVHGNLDYDAFYTHGYQEIYPLWPLGMLNNIAFCQVAINFDIQGPNSVFSAHGDSGATAIAEAVKTVGERKAQLVLAGGVREKVSAMSLARAQLAGILSTSGDRAVCRPFAAERQGTVLGEGCGMLVLELASSAEARGVPCLAAVTGLGCACEVEEDNGRPVARTIAQAMQEALASAGIKPGDVDLVIAHGDGTYTGDKHEIAAINQVFEDCLDKVKVVATKGALGHMLAAAPVVDLIVGLEVLKNGMAPATLNAVPVDGDIKFTIITSNSQPVYPGRVMINSISYEGQCSSLIIESVD